MENLSEAQFAEMYKNLPSDLKQLLNSSNINDGIAQVCEDYGFPDKLSEVQKNIALVLMGTLSLEDFKNYLNLLAQQGSIPAYNKLYALTFGQVEQYLITENGQTFFGSEPAPTPKDNPTEPLKTSSDPPPPIKHNGSDPYREKPE